MYQCKQVWQINIHYINERFDEGTPLFTFYFPFSRSTNPEQLQLVTMIFEKLVTEIVTTEIANQYDKYTQGKLDFSNLIQTKEIVEEIHIRMRKLKTPFTGASDIDSFAHTLKKVVPQELQTIDQSILYEEFNRHKKILAIH